MAGKTKFQSLLEKQYNDELSLPENDPTLSADPYGFESRDRKNLQEKMAFRKALGEASLKSVTEPIEYVNTLGGMVSPEALSKSARGKPVYASSGILEWLAPELAMAGAASKASKAAKVAEETFGGAKAAAEGEYGARAALRRLGEKFKRKPVQELAENLPEAPRALEKLEGPGFESPPVAEGGLVDKPQTFESDLRGASEATRPGIQESSFKNLIETPKKTPKVHKEPILAEKTPLGFYSKAEELILNKMGNKATKEQVEAILKSAKPEELESLNVNKLLNSSLEDRNAKLFEKFQDTGDVEAFKNATESIKKNPNSFTKEEILDYFKQNRPRLSTKTFQKDPELYNIRAKWEAVEARKREIEGAQRQLRKVVNQQIESGAIKPHEDIVEELFGIGTTPRSSEEANLFKLESELQSLSKQGEELSAQFHRLKEASERPKFEDYALPGENYKETLIQEPSAQGYDKNHWKVPDNIAHARSSQMVDTEGNKLFHVDEVQSDLHQMGRERGYVRKGAIEEAQALDNDLKNTSKKLDEVNDQIAIKRQELYEKFENESPELRAINNQLEAYELEKRKYLENMFDDTDASRLAKDKYLEILDAEESLLSKKQELLTDFAYNKLEEVPEIKELRNIHDDMLNKYDTILNSRLSVKGLSDIPDAKYKKSWGKLTLRKMLMDAVESGASRMSWTPGEIQAARYPAMQPENKVGLAKFYDEMIPSMIKDIAKDAPMGKTTIKVGEDLVQIPYVEITPKLKEEILKKGLPFFTGAGAIGASQFSNLLSEEE